MASSKIRMCGYCGKPIHDQMLMAMGKCWHKGHFMCAHCQKPLKVNKFIEEGGKPYCSADWDKLFKHANAPLCAQCNSPITDTVITALGKTWHKEHFVCEHCKQPFHDGKFIPEDGKAYCDADHKKLFPGKEYRGTSLQGNQVAGSHGNEKSTNDKPTTPQTGRKNSAKGPPKCAHCKKSIKDSGLSALGKHWHKDHLLCAQCKKPIHMDFNSHDGKPYCDNCYVTNYGKRCSGCDMVIEGTFLTALEKFWHKPCFKCKKCGNPISAQQDFKERNGSPFCLPCADG